MLFYSHFKVNSDRSRTTATVEAILAWLAPFTDHAITPMAWRQCQLAIVEGYTNAVYHAHQNLPPATPIQIELTGYAHALEVCIWDQGPPFDLLAYLAQLPELPEQEAEHGRGVRIIRRVADELTFERVGAHHNCLVFMKYRTPTPLPSASTPVPKR